MHRQRRDNQRQNHRQHQLRSHAIGRMSLLVVDQAGRADEAHERNRNDGDADGDEGEAVVMAE